MEPPNFADPAGHKWERWACARHTQGEERQADGATECCTTLCMSSGAQGPDMRLPDKGQCPSDMAAKMMWLLALGRLAPGCHACDSRSPVQPKNTHA